MPYITRQMKIGNSSQVRQLSLEAGAVYSSAVKTFWRVFRKKNHWLSLKDMQKIVRNNNLHSQSVQGITQTFYEALKSWNALRRKNPSARPPRKHRLFHPIPFKESAIKIKDDMLILSTGRGNEPVIIPWKFDKPKFCEISYKLNEFVLNAVYQKEAQVQKSEGEVAAGVLIGRTHIGAAYLGKNTHIANGRELRSKYLYKDKMHESFNSKMDKCEKNSRKWKRLEQARRRILNNINNQIKDILHKQTTALVCAMKEHNVQTVGIGYMRNIQMDNGCVESLRVLDHHAPLSKVREMIAYKATFAGIKVRHIDDDIIKHACPVCVEHNEPDDLTYLCKLCGFQSHRYCVGAVNINHFTKYREHVPVVGDMTPPVGIRYYADSLRKSAASVA